MQQIRGIKLEGNFLRMINIFLDRNIIIICIEVISYLSQKRIFSKIRSKNQGNNLFCKRIYEIILITQNKLKIGKNFKLTDKRKENKTMKNLLFYSVTIIIFALFIFLAIRAYDIESSWNEIHSTRYGSEVNIEEVIKCLE